MSGGEISWKTWEVTSDHTSCSENELPISDLLTEPLTRCAMPVSALQIQAACLTRAPIFQPPKKVDCRKGRVGDVQREAWWQETM